MNTPKWVQDAIFYQIFPDRFARSKRSTDPGFEAWDPPPTMHGFKGGDLDGITEHLDYLQDLGINALYLNPIFASASNHRYHPYDYYQVDPLLGGNAALRRMLDAAHKRKIRVVLDGVFNHASRGLWQFHHVLETGGASPYKDWFHFDPDRLDGKRLWGAYPAQDEVEAIKREGSFKAIGYQGWWNLPALPKFNTRTQAVRQFLFEVAEHWIRFGIDGWRLDVPAEIDDDEFWREFRRRVKTVNPEAYIVGEIWHDAQRWLQGDQFDAVMNYPIAIAALGFCAGPRIKMEVVNEAGGLRDRVQPLNAEKFGDEIERTMSLYPREITNAQLNLLDSHDTPRFLSSAGNDPASLKLALLFLFTIPGAPCIYYGDEIGLTGRQDPDCRKSFPWSEAVWDKEILQYVRSLIELRKRSTTLRRGVYQRLYAKDGVFAFSRYMKKELLAVVLNCSEASQHLKLPGPAVKKEPKILFGKLDGFEIYDQKYTLTIPARTGVVMNY